MIIEPKQVVVVASIWKNGKLLLGRKTEDSTAQIAGQWHIPGGKVRSGECPITALCREIWEETGMAFMREDFKFICATSPDDQIYLWFWVEGWQEPRVRMGTDVVELGWFDNPDEVMGANCTYPAAATQPRQSILSE